MPSSQPRINIVDLKKSFFKLFQKAETLGKEFASSEIKLDQLMTIKDGNLQALLAWLDFREQWTRVLGRFAPLHDPQISHE